jgi:hypothetical protein
VTAERAILREIAGAWSMARGVHFAVVEALHMAGAIPSGVFQSSRAYAWMDAVHPLIWAAAHLAAGAVILWHAELYRPACLFAAALWLASFGCFVVANPTETTWIHAFVAASVAYLACARASSPTPLAGPPSPCTGTTTSAGRP